MGSRGTTVIDLLEKEWPNLEAAPASGRQLRRWADREADLAPFATLAELRAAVEDRSTTAEARDGVLLAVVRHAATDDLAARTLLQLLLPGCKAMVGRFGWTDDIEEVAAAVVAATYDRIRTYPVERRPGRVAANILLDVKQRLFWRSPTRVPTVCLDEVSHSVPAAEPEPHAAAELLDLLQWAVEAGHLSLADAQLIGTTRVAGETVDDLCTRDGEKPQTMRRRRQRAEQRLALAAMAAA